MIIGKVFEDLSNGQTGKVETVSEGIAILNNGKRIAVERLMDKNYYSEHMDFNSMENTFYNSLASSLSNLNTDNMGDFNAPEEVNISVNPVESHNEAQRRLQNDDLVLDDYQVRELERRKKEVAENASRMKNAPSNAGLEKYLDEDDKPVQNMNLVGVKMEGENHPIQQNNITVNNVDSVEVERQYIPSQNDPVYEMFRNVKRSTNFSLTLKINEKIPRKDFIKMWEDNYEKSIIDFLADEFVDNLLSDPSVLKEEIRNSLKKHVYNKPKPRK